MREPQKKPVIRKIVSRKPKHKHHGGAWKVAYADFMTAMMAFFLLLWLLSSAPQQKTAGLAAYFNPKMQLANVGADGVLSGRGLDPDEGLYQSGNDKLHDGETQATGTDSEDDIGMPHAKIANPWLSFTDEFGGRSARSLLDAMPQVDPDPSLADAFATLGAFLDPKADLADVSVTDDGGVQVDLLDPDGAPLFTSGSFDLTPASQLMLEQIVESLQQSTGRVALIGHSDAAPLSGDAYGNWELSSDRAHALRRALVQAGLDPARIISVAGVADTQPLDSASPEAAQNRRVSIRIYP